MERGEDGNRPVSWAMYKLLVCDDEKWIREGICAAIDWEELGVTTIIKARDGLQAMELVRREKPDLVITDIKMPNFGGLEMIDAIRQEVDPACVIVISGFSNFEYARTALLLGVADYLLKPIDEEALLQASKKCLKALAGKAQLQKQQQAAQLYHLSGWLDNGEPAAHGTVTALRTLGVNTEALPCVQVAVARLEPGREAPPGAPPLETAGLAEGAVRQVLLQKSPGELVGLFFAAGPVEEDGVAREMVRSAWGRGAAVGISDWVPFDRGWAGYRQAAGALLYRLLDGEGVHRHSWVAARKEKALEAFPHFHISRPTAHLVTKEYRQYREWLENAFALVEEQKEALNPRELLGFFTALVRNVGRIWGLEQQPEFQAYCDGFPLLWDRETLRRQLAALPSRLPETRHLGVNKSFVQALEYIDRHFDSPLSMQRVAQAVDLNASYFSKMFSDCAGEPFLKYVARLRMEKAKRLLHDTGDKIYEVAEKVGYSDYRIFSKNFKEYVGVSPADYRSWSP